MRQAEALATIYFLACGHSRAEVASFLQVSPSTIAGALRDLEALDLSPDSSDTGTLGDVAREILSQLDPMLVDEPDLRHWKGRVWKVDAPWADVLDGGDAEAPDSLGPGTSVVTADFEDMLRRALTE